MYGVLTVAFPLFLGEHQNCNTMIFTHGFNSSIESILIEYLKKNKTPILLLFHPKGISKTDLKIRYFVCFNLKKKSPWTSFSFSRARRCLLTADGGLRRPGEALQVAPSVAPWLTVVVAVSAVVEPGGWRETSSAVFVLPTAKTVTSYSPRKFNEAAMNLPAY